MKGMRRYSKYVCLAVLFLVGACRTDGKEPNVPQRDINTVLKAHTEELMKIPGVVGVAIGETESGVPCIKVLVKEKTAEVIEKIPKDLEGHPVEIIETGEVRAMPEDDG
jgi:hypothetical protein